MLGEALQQTEESGIAALEERLARRGESGSLAEAETALTSLLQKLSLKPVRLIWKGQRQTTSISLHALQTFILNLTRQPDPG